MYPGLIHLPLIGLPLETDKVFVLLAIVFCLLAAPRWAEALEGLAPAATRRTLLVLALVVLAAGRLHYVLNALPIYTVRPLDAFKFWTGGFHLGGGIAALALASPALARRNGIAPGKFADGITPTFALAMAITRVGCFVHGCCFGTVCH